MPKSAPNTSFWKIEVELGHDNHKSHGPHCGSSSRVEGTLNAAKAPQHSKPQE